MALTSYLQALLDKLLERQNPISVRLHTSQRPPTRPWVYSASIAAGRSRSGWRTKCDAGAIPSSTRGFSRIGSPPPRLHIARRLSPCTLEPHTCGIQHYGQAYTRYTAFGRKEDY
ncbi:hypothetical protein MIND_00560900 [Mycena indigotica]|uniref:Uncharacterized protein n=1 Tax=Mycena indigotica TaxID=2126181 RepID=A0A8H6SYA3_9AGAR|nr:uncharacterized protein MIND_00560900 [Mycena indigotica]KAF7307656.1 hypothetical protein MIND_00560900 [Mycena indigotica]